MKIADEIDLRNSYLDIPYTGMKSSKIPNSITI